MTKYYLTIIDVVAIHSAQIDRFGGAPGVRDAGLIQSAVERPQSGYYSDTIEEAAAFWESLTMNHGFVDGNKRIGVAAAMVFLEMNGFTIDLPETALSNFVLGHIENGNFNKHTIEDWLRNNIKILNQ